MIKVHGVCASPFVRKVLLCLDIKGLEYQQIDVFPVNMPESFKLLSPLLKIPALEDGDLSIADSSVICQYLNDKYPNVNMLPESLEDQAKARWLERYADTKLAEVASGIFFERKLKPLMGKVTDEEKVGVLINEKLPEQYQYLETQMPEQGFLFGEKLMVADIALVTHFINASYAAYNVDKSLAPKFAAYLERVKALPVVKNRMEQDVAFFTAMAKS